MGGGTKYFYDGLTKGVKWRDEHECNPPKHRTSSTEGLDNSGGSGGPQQGGVYGTSGIDAPAKILGKKQWRRDNKKECMGTWVTWPLEVSHKGDAGKKMIARRKMDPDNGWFFYLLCIFYLY